MRIDLNGDSIFIATGGRPFDPEKPTVVFIHGSGQSAVGWSQQTRAFAYAGYGVLAPDLPGHGLSGGSALADVATAAEWIAAMLDAVGASEAHLVGHSQGALVALAFAAAYPERTRSLSIVAAAAAIPVNPGLIKLAESKESKAIAAMTAWGTGAFGHAHDSDVPGASTIGAGMRLMARNAPGSLATDLKACAAYEGGSGAASQVKAPAFCLLAEKDRMTPLKGGLRLAEQLKAETEVIAGAGHMLPGEQPVRTLNALRRFIDKQAA